MKEAEWMKNEPVLIPQGKKDWRLAQSYIRIIDNEYHKVTEGFITDLASVPRFLWVLIPPYGRHTGAAIIHDWYYRNGDKHITRAEADWIMFRVMKVDGCSFLKRWIIYIGLRLFGRRAFKKSTSIHQ